MNSSSNNAANASRSWWSTVTKWVTSPSRRCGCGAKKRSRRDSSDKGSWKRRRRPPSSGSIGRTLTTVPSDSSASKVMLRPQVTEVVTIRAVDEPASVGQAGPRQLRRLLDAVLVVGSDLRLETVLHRIVEAATELSGARYGALGVLDESGTRLVDFVTV